MTREEQNRKLAEWLGWKAKPRRLKPDLFIWVSPNGGQQLDVPDFFASEEASALLLEKMLWSCGCSLNAQRVTEEGGKERTVSIAMHVPIRIAGINPWTFGPDRKASVAMAALKLIEQEEACKSKS